MPHDQVWKELLWAFFRDFMELFFPQAAARLNFGRARLLDKELFTDFAEGSRREPDLVVEVYTTDGEPEIILVHVEVQARREADVPARMWEYYALLRFRHRHPVYPIVVYLSPGAGGLTHETYRESVLGHNVLRFRYSAVGLPDLPGDQYLSAPSVLAPALSALMRTSDVGKPSHMARALQRVAEAPLDEARRGLLAHVVGTYITLSSEEQAELARLMAEPGLAEARNMVNVFEQKALQKGIEQGIERGIEQGIARGIEEGISEGLAQGEARGKRELITKLYASKFGEPNRPFVAALEATTDIGALDRLFESVLAAGSPDEVQLASG